MSNTVKWGIMGCGNIARKFAEAVQIIDEADLTAAASRTEEKARDFAGKFNIPKAYGSYEAMVNNKDIDAIYVATPHNYHLENTRLCLEHDKAVLCEKPMTVNAEETEEIINLAREKDIFVMEAMWTRFLPAIRDAKRTIEEGAIGAIKSLRADFSFSSGRGLDSRVFNPDLAGGALLDVGIYPITFASIIKNELPEVIKSIADIGESGVDYSSAYLFRYKDGILAQLNASVVFNGTKDAYVFGENGFLRIPMFWQSTSFEIHPYDGESNIREFPFESNGFEYEIREASQCIIEGRSESHVHPLQQTLSIMKTMDEMRKQWGLVYPFEKGR